MNRQSKNIAIIGAGASGIFCAIVAKEKNPHLQITLYEQSSKIARKVLASGNGHCNITNQNISQHNYTSQNPEFVESILHNFTFKDLENFMLKHALPFIKKEDGRCYPYSNEAKSVVKIFNALLDKLHIKIIYDEQITKIVSNKNAFHINSKIYDAVVVATGSEAAPQLGGNSSGYTIAKSFQHTIVDTYPSLVQLHLEGKTHQHLSGVRLNAVVTLSIDGKKEKSCEGDILFTNYGVSGLTILDLSQQASLALSYEQNVTISVNLMPQFTPQQLSSFLQKLSKSDLTIDATLSAIIPSKIVSLMLQELHINPSMHASGLNAKNFKQIGAYLQFQKYTIEQTHGFKHAEVSGGGVSTFEVDAQTLQSHLQKNLFFVGEVLDVVGDRGGYNFHFSFASAYSCALALTKL